MDADVPRWSLLEVAAQRALLAHLAGSPLAQTAAVLDAGRNAQDHLLDLQLGVQRPATPADPPHADAAGRTAFASSLQLYGNRRA